MVTLLFNLRRIIIQYTGTCAWRWALLVMQRCGARTVGVRTTKYIHGTAGRDKKHGKSMMASIMNFKIQVSPWLCELADDYFVSVKSHNTTWYMSPLKDATRDKTTLYLFVIIYCRVRSSIRRQKRFISRYKHHQSGYYCM